MFYTKKEKRKLKKELLDELERISKKDDEEENIYRSSYSYSHNENNREILEGLYEMIIGLQNDFEKLSRRVEKIEQRCSDTKVNAVTSQRRDTETKAMIGAITSEMLSDESLCTKFNKYINTGSMHNDFKSINLTYEIDMFSETDNGTALYYIVHLYDNEYELYPNHRFVDRRACQRAEMAFDFDIQGNQTIYVNKPCRLRKLMYGYAVEEKGKVSIL